MPWFIGGAVALALAFVAYSQNMLCGIGLCSGGAAGATGPMNTNGWTPVSQGAVPQAAINGITTQINSGGAAWQPYPNGPQSPPVASPNAVGPEDSTGPGAGANGTPPFYAMDNSSGQWYQHA